jgi:hypothetical protein
MATNPTSEGEVMADKDDKTTAPGDSGSNAPAKDEGPSPSEQFRQEQQAQAAQQNLSGENVVPEQRPQAFQTPRGEDTESRTHLALKEEGDPLVANEPMPKSAYDKAGSKKQRDEAAKNSRSPTIREGARVRLKNIGNGWDGRNAVVLTVNYSRDQHQLRELGTAESMYAEPDHFIIRTRDGRTDTRQVNPDQVELVPDGDWGRSAI